MLYDTKIRKNIFTRTYTTLLFICASVHTQW